MPELPEVECVRRGLARIVISRKITDSEILHDHFKPGRQPMPVGLVRDVRRHGKWLVARVDDVNGPCALCVNLGMSGKFVVTQRRALEPTPKHTRWRLRIDADTVLNYVDPRCMGRLRILRDGAAVLALSRMAASRGITPLNVGPDWLAPVVTRQTSTAINFVRDALCDTPHEMKRVLLDQSRLAGLGNIYASEACYLARISPFTPAESIPYTAIKRLQRLVPDMLTKSIALGGTSLKDANSYVDVSGAEGEYAERLNVYGRAGQPCYGRCGKKIVKVKQAGRSTYYCPKCQQ